MTSPVSDKVLQMASYKGIFNVSGQVAIVTGAGGFLGVQICKGLAEYGAQVVLVDVDVDSLESAMKKLETELPSMTFMSVDCDITDPDSVDTMIHSVLSEFQKIDILVNNATTKGGDPSKFFAASESYQLDIYQEVNSVNIDGYFLVSQKVGKFMLEKRSGAIVQIASIYGSLGANQSLYIGAKHMGTPINSPLSFSVAKSAVVGLSRHLATEWGPKGIRVNSVSPGEVYSGQNEEFRQQYSDRVPVKLMGKPGDIVGAVLYLVSPAASYVNGHNLVVDGGFSVW